MFDGFEECVYHFVESHVRRKYYIISARFMCLIRIFASRKRSSAIDYGAASASVAHVMEFDLNVNSPSGSDADAENTDCDDDESDSDSAADCESDPYLQGILDEIAQPDPDFVPYRDVADEFGSCIYDILDSIGISDSSASASADSGSDQLRIWLLKMNLLRGHAEGNATGKRIELTSNSMSCLNSVHGLDDDATRLRRPRTLHIRYERRYPATEATLVEIHVPVQGCQTD